MTTTALHPHRQRLIHPQLVGAGATLLIAALITDIVYAKTAEIQWSNFSEWMITGGLILAAFAALALLADHLRGRLGPISWWRFGVLAAAVLLSILNAFIHGRDGWTSVVPQGLTLTAIVAVLLLIVGWGGWSLAADDHHLARTRETRP